MDKVDYKNYLNMAKFGHYPLFFEEWMLESLQTKSHLNFKKAQHNVRHVFHLLSRHNSVEKKRTALISMDKISREEFIRSFMKVVETDILQDNKTLQ